MTAFKTDPDKKELRNFGLITGSMAAGIFGIVLPLIFGHPFPKWPWIAGGVLAAWALLAPATLKPIYLVWMTIGHALGWVNSRIILGIMFYLIILPVGLIRRLSGKDSMARERDGKRGSYRIKSSAPERTHVEKPF